MTWIKICGTTNLEDALAAVEAGADALGFVFAESTRRISAESAAEIIGHVPVNVEKIGVFVSETSEQIKRIAAQAGLTAVQLHRWAEDQGRSRVEVIPVLHMTNIEELECNALLSLDKRFRRLLLDSGNAEKGGGTGKRFDWIRAAAFLKSASLADRFQVIVAGGLTPENVGEAVDVFHPFGVDVVSGVEREKGKKDLDKVRAFVAAVRAADARAQEASKVKTCQ